MQPSAAPDRFAAAQTALIAGVHAGQIALAASTPGASALFAPDARVPTAELATTFRALVTLPRERWRAWDAGAADAEIERGLARLAAHPAPADPRLPVRVAEAAIRARLGRDDRSIASVANLVQLNLQQSEDGLLLQDLFHVYHALGSKLNLEQLGVAGGDDVARELGRACAAAAAPGPFPANDAAYWHLTFARVAMWGDKYSGIRDHHVLARELAREPDIAALLPRLAAAPPARSAFIGYSLMMSVNWSTHGAWNDIASEVRRAVDPRFAYAGFQYGGIGAQDARRRLLPDALAWKPTEAFLMMCVDDEADVEALTDMARRLKDGGAKVWLIDEVRPWIRDDRARPWPERRREAARRAGVACLPWLELGKADPTWPTWECLDYAHMTTPGHLFYARALLRLWAEGVAAPR